MAFISKIRLNSLHNMDRTESARKMLNIWHFYQESGMRVERRNFFCGHLATNFNDFVPGRYYFLVITNICQVGATIKTN